MDPDGSSLDVEGWISISLKSEKWCIKEERINPYIYICIWKNNLWWHDGNTNVHRYNEPLAYL